MTPKQTVIQLLDQMIWIDFALAGVVAVCLLIGLLRGAGKETLSLCNWAVASGVGWFFADDFTQLMKSSITHPNAQIAAAFAILLLLTLIVSGFVFFLTDYKKKKSRISIVSHIAGIPIGFLRSLILVNLIVIFAGLTPLPSENWWQKSAAIPPFQASVNWLKTHFPSGFSGYLRYR